MGLNEPSEELRLLTDENNHRISSLSAQGIGIGGMGQERILCYLTVIAANLGVLDEAEIAFQTHLAQALSAMETEARKRSLIVKPARGRLPGA